MEDAQRRTETMQCQLQDVGTFAVAREQELVGEVARVTEERDAARAELAQLRLELEERRRDDEVWQQTGGGHEVIEHKNIAASDSSATFSATKKASPGSAIRRENCKGRKRAAEEPLRGGFLCGVAVQGKAMRLVVWQQLKHDMHVEIQQAHRVSNLMAKKLLSRNKSSARDVSGDRSNSAVERVLLQHYGGAAARPALQ
jgi:hypothetical protein